MIADTIVPLAWFGGAMLAYVAAVFASLWYFVLRSPPGTREPGLLRTPAHACEQRLRVVDHRLVGAAVGIPLALFAWHLVLTATAMRAGATAPLVALACAGLAALGWFGRELLALWPERVRLLRSIAAQKASARSLSVLMRQGYWVFHDLHLDGRRIDHLVLGPRGIFCIASIGRSLPRRWTWRGRRPVGSPRVEFDGQALSFPGWQERESFAEIQAAARWMQRLLARAAGEPEASLPTFAGLAIPGWRVVSTSWRHLIVFNPSTPMMLVQGAASGSRLDGSTAQTLVKYLQKNCRAKRAPARQRPWRRRPAEWIRSLRRRWATGAASR